MDGEALTLTTGLQAKQARLAGPERKRHSRTELNEGGKPLSQQRASATAGTALQPPVGAGGLDEGELEMGLGAHKWKGKWTIEYEGSREVRYFTRQADTDLVIDRTIDQRCARIVNGTLPLGWVNQNLVLCYVVAFVQILGISLVFSTPLLASIIATDFLRPRTPRCRCKSIAPTPTWYGSLVFL